MPQILRATIAASGPVASMAHSPKTHHADYAVVGCGIAGLRAAIELSAGGSVLVLAKSDLSDSATAHAQGGIAVALSDEDEVSLHEQDTIQAGDGLGQIYRETTNPDVATGDGMAIAYEAGALLSDMEFIQFHPTALAVKGAPRFLLSEALRGEGGILRNVNLDRFMKRYSEAQELAPR